MRWGKDMTVAELIEIVLADRGFYMKSGGGVTLSGGEVMLQWEFASELLAACKKNYIHTCVESALHCGPETATAVFENADMVITDIKHMDSGRHRELTGAGNERILENILLTSELGKPMVIRIPVVAGCNNDEANIRATGAFIRDKLHNNILQLQLLPYRKMGLEKYDSLNQTYPMGEDFVAPERSAWEENILELTEMLREYGVPAVAGSNVKLPGAH
jgi:pyruvate formate lyase activating enzyme